MRKMKIIEDGNYSFDLTSRSGEYAMIGEKFADIFEMSHQDCMVDLAEMYFKNSTAKVTKWYIYTKNNSIISCQDDYLRCKLSTEDYELLQTTEFIEKIKPNTLKRAEDRETIYIRSDK